jgi:peroxiredoxin
VNKLIPQTEAPDLELNLLHREKWSLENHAANTFNMVVVYRGYHCPICRTYLTELKRLQPEFNDEGVQIVAVSTDGRERAEKSRDEWGIQSLAIGYDLSESQMNEWGLYLSEGIKPSEPALFAEPALFLVEPDKTLFYCAYNSMPFGRPNLEDMLEAVKFVKKNDYPARGEKARAAANLW